MGSEERRSKTNTTLSQARETVPWTIRYHKPRAGISRDRHPEQVYETKKTNVRVETRTQIQNSPGRFPSQSGTGIIPDVCASACLEGRSVELWKEKRENNSAETILSVCVKK